MKQKKMLALTLSQLEQLYRHELPELVSIAVQSDDAEAFKANLAEYIAGHPEVDSEAGKQIRLLIEFDGQEVHELSIGEQLPISTLSMLNSFLTGQWEEERKRTCSSTCSSSSNASTNPPRLCPPHRKSKP